MTTEPDQRTDVGLVHEELPYRDDRECCEGVLSFVHAALAADQPVLA